MGPPATQFAASNLAHMKGGIHLEVGVADAGCHGGTADSRTSHCWEREGICADLLSEAIGAPTSLLPLSSPCILFLSFSSYNLSPKALIMEIILTYALMASVYTI